MTENTTEVNYGEEACYVLDCLSEIVNGVYNSPAISVINKLREELKTIPEYRWKGFRPNPTYKSKSSQLDVATDCLRGTAKTVVGQFNERNNKDFHNVSESVSSYRYDSRIGAHESKILGDAFISIFDEQELLSLAVTKKPSILKPSALFESFSNLKDMVITNFSGESVESISSKSGTEGIETELFYNKSIGEILDKSAKAIVSMRSTIKPELTSFMRFESGKIELISINYKTKTKDLTKENKRWLETNVNTITGHYYTPKSA